MLRYITPKIRRFGLGELSLYLAMLFDSIGLGSYLSTSFLYFVIVWSVEGRESGIVLAIVGAVSLICLAPGGRLADFFGPGNALCLTSGIRVLGFLVMAMASNFTFGVIGCLIAGVVGRAAGPIAQSAVLSLSSSSDQSATLLANYRMLRNFGFGIGGVAAGTAVAIGTPLAYRGLYGLAAILFLVGLVILLLWLPHKGPQVFPVGGNSDNAQSKTRIPLGLLILTAYNGALSLHAFIFSIVAPFWLARQSLVPTWTASLVMVINTLLVVVLQRPLSKGTEIWQRAAHFTFISMLIIAVGCLFPLLAVASNQTMVATGLFLLGIIVITVGEVMQTAGVYGMVLPYLESKERTYRMAVFGFGFSIATIVGPIISGYVAPTGDIGWAYIAAYFVTVAVFFIMTLRWIEKQVNLGKENNVVDS